MVEVPARFIELIATITDRIRDQPVEPALADTLERKFPADGPVFSALEALCRQGCAEGWLCTRQAGGIRFGRAVKPGTATHGFSVDVVEMTEVVGPHHRHPNGEIDMVMPLDGAACFDDKGRGWMVYGPDSAHSPTVTGGSALILYLLPKGAIDFGG